MVIFFIIDMYDDDGNLMDDYSYIQLNVSEIVVVNVIYKWLMFIFFMNFSLLDYGNECYFIFIMVFRNELWE